MKIGKIEKIVLRVLDRHQQEIARHRLTYTDQMLDYYRLMRAVFQKDALASKNKVTFSRCLRSLEQKALVYLLREGRTVTHAKITNKGTLIIKAINM